MGWSSRLFLDCGTPPGVCFRRPPSGNRVLTLPDLQSFLLLSHPEAISRRVRRYLSSLTPCASSSCRPRGWGRLLLLLRTEPFRQMSWCCFSRLSHPSDAEKGSVIPFSLAYSALERAQDGTGHHHSAVSSHPQELHHNLLEVLVL